jgi:hypothetical protein
MLTTKDSNRPDVSALTVWIYEVDTAVALRVNLHSWPKQSMYFCHERIIKVPNFLFINHVLQFYEATYAEFFI